MQSRSGLTILEILFTITLITFLVSSILVVYIVSLQGWDNLGHRADLHKKLHFGLDRIAREVHKANDLLVANNAVRFTLYESGSNQSYIYYLHNASDTWPPAFNQSAYDLKRTSLAGGINGTFTYGDGELVIAALKPPSLTAITSSGDVATLTLTGQIENDIVTLRSAICARNK